MWSEAKVPPTKPDAEALIHDTAERARSDRLNAVLLFSGLQRLVFGLQRLVQDVREGRALFGIMRGYLWFIPATTILAILTSTFEGAGLTLVIPLVQSLADDAQPIPSHGYLGLLQRFVLAIPTGHRTASVLALIFGSVLAKNLFGYLNLALLAVVYGRVSHELRLAIYQRVVSTPLAKLERLRSGELLNVLNNETWRATDALNLVFSVVTSLATAIVFVALLVLISWKLALIAIGGLSLTPLIVQLVLRRVRALSKEALIGYETLSQHTWSTLNGLRTIHTFGREHYEQKRFGAISDRVRGLFLRMSLVGMTTGPITEITATVVIAVLILLVSAKLASVGTLIAFIALLYRLQPRLTSLAQAQSSLATLHASIAAVSEILNREPDRVVACAGVPQPPAGPVSFRRVTFKYEDTAAPAIEDLSFELPSAGLIAVVGASGAGKSTLLDLLLGFQFPQAGDIRIGGVALTEDVAPAWRRRIGVVNQDPYVFDDTVRANIMYGRPEASAAEMIRAARAVIADDFIRALAHGYDTRIGERAVQLSGGQRQRLALARALLRDPDVLVLDEATNALDAGTEADLQATLRAFARDRVVLVVAHKLSTVRAADQVLMLEAGRLVEQGAPDALLNAGGPFARMFSPAVQWTHQDTIAAAADRQ